MKKVILAFAVMVTATSTFAQKEDVKPNIVKLNPLGFAFGSGSIAYERALSEKNSFVIAPTFGGFNFGGFKYTSFGAGGEYRFYLSNTKTAPAGFYAAPGVGFSTGKIKETGTSDKASFTSFNVKGVVGNQWVLNSGFVVDLNGGLQYSSFSYSDNNNSVFSGLKGSGVFPALAVAIGYNF
jgi:hypothetical protein